MRRPLAWLILLEVVVVAALAATTYHLVMERTPTPAAASPVIHNAAPKKVPPTPAAPFTPTPPVPPTPRPLGPLPGLNFDPAFWSGQLQRINQDQHVLEQLQWRLTAAVTDWIRAYVNHVLVPAMEQAEKH